MIVRNEERHLGRCLASAAPLVQEIVVVDTGSTDRTRDIARGYGARLFDHPWEDDFSRARNHSLAQAREKWILVLDADETLAARDHARLRALIAAAERPAAAFSIRTRNYTARMNVVGWQANRGEYPAEEAGNGWFPSDKVRLFPNDPAIRFERAVHEMVEPSLRRAGIPIVPCEIPVHHYGKLEEALCGRKTRVYSRIGAEKVRESGSDPAAVREAAIQAAQLGRHEEALAMWRKLLACGFASAEAHLNAGTALWHLARYPEAVAAAEEALRLDPALKEARFNLAMAELYRGNAERAVGLLEPLVQSHPDYAAGRFLLSAACGCSGSAERAQSVLAPLRESPLGAYLSVSFFDLARGLEAAGRRQAARAVCGIAVDGGFAAGDLKAWMMSLEPLSMR
jgi:tetratricopeptide (TPR) repeat protein